MHTLILGVGIGELSDAVADVLWRYHNTLVAVGLTDAVTLPIAVDGAATTCRLRLHPASPLALVAVVGSSPGDLPGDAETLAGLERRIVEVDPFGAAGGFGPDLGDSIPADV